jgi:cysteinyl-tRNA synthetase
MLELYNTLSRKKEALKPKLGKKLNLFVCGITPYDYAHIGHARTYVVFDAFARYLKTLGYRVFYLQNVTDIDDKIIKRAQQKNLPAKALAKMFEREYLEDMKTLGIESVDKYARATDYIPEIISQAKRLLDKGYAYKIEKDGLYYDVLKFKDYGKLSGRTSLQAQDAVSRIDEGIKKRNKGDFALWKLSKKGEPSWPSPWGLGRPGWHIEDTAITEKHFGPQYDLHGGARDLIFPHHEAEIAQMEAISGKKPMAKYWMHTGFLTVKGEKMSKSLGNFVTIRDFLKQHSPRTLRLLVLKAHYRSPIDYSDKLILQTVNELERIDEFTDKLGSIKNIGSGKGNIQKIFKDAKGNFQKALKDDFNTPRAIAAVFTLITQANAMLDKQKLSKKDAKAILEFFKQADTICNFIFFGKKHAKIPPSILKLAKDRETYRKEKQWQKADKLRQELLKKGWQPIDTAQGPKLKKIT